MAKLVQASVEENPWHGYCDQTVALYFEGMPTDQEVRAAFVHHWEEGGDPVSVDTKSEEFKWEVIPDEVSERANLIKVFGYPPQI